MQSRVLLATLLAAATAFAAERWTSPDKFYSMAPPSGWSYREDAPGSHRSFAWISPDEKAEIRISATYNLVRLQKDLPDLVVDAFFPDQRGTTPIQKVNGTGWDGLRREVHQCKSEHSLAGSRRAQGLYCSCAHDERARVGLRPFSSYFRICLAFFETP